MYKIYWTNEQGTACSTDVAELKSALTYCSLLRAQDLLYVTMVSDYQGMVGKPGASGTDSNYVPQMLNA